MPIFRVEKIDYYDVAQEEYWRAYRTDTRTRIYEIEADNEDEAREMLEYGDIDEDAYIDEDYDCGDTYDSEYYDTGEDIYSELQETEYNVSEHITYRRPVPPKPKPKWRM